MSNESPKQPVAASQPSASTGPRTQAGKAISSQNARKHDLCSRTLNLTSDEWAEYNDTAERYRRDLQPANDVEQTLIDEICFNYWRLQQAREVELRIIAEHPVELPIISLYIRYRTGYERGYYKALDKLQQTQRIRKQEAARADGVRSAKSPAAPSRRSSASPSEPVPSEIPATETAAILKDELDDHSLENRVRSELCLPPLPVPPSLARRVKEFVSLNSARPHSELEDLLDQAA